MKKIIALLLALTMAFTLASCGSPSPSPSPSVPDAGAQDPDPTTNVQDPVDPTDDGNTDDPADSGEANTAEGQYIAVISKGFQHQFWQVVKKGAEQAAADLGVTITFEGPPSESDINIQVDMLKAAMDKQPAAIALAALDTESVKEQLNDCLNKGIPVVGFDSGVPNAPEGSIYATASTDNKAAAAIAADELFKNEAFKAKFDAATGDSPIVVGVLSQDATSESIISRTTGFIDQLVSLAGAENVSVTGHTTYEKAVAGAKLNIVVNVPATTSAADQKTGAEMLLGTAGIVAIYGSNENAAGGMLAASNDGSEFAEGSKYGEILALGFDAGKTQKVAVTNGWFLGSVTQDPYQIGYKAVALAVDAINGKPAESPIVDTGAKWYNKDNISDPMINDLVYE